MRRQYFYKKRKKRSPVLPVITVVILIIAVAAAARGFLLRGKPASAASIDRSPAATTKVSPSPSPLNYYGMAFETITKTQEDMYQGLQILVNRDHPYQFVDFEKFSNLYDNKTSDYKVAYTDIKAGNDTLAPLNAMFSAFYSNIGESDVYVISGYRSKDRQQELFEQEVAEVGEKEAPKWVLPPGTSEHHTGLAIDLGLYDAEGNYHEFDGSGKYAWIDNNCFKFGFIVRYSDAKRNITKVYHEPWHLRYIGVAHAAEITRLGLCFEEYIDFLRAYTWDNPLRIETYDGGVYDTYFCKGLTVYVPQTGPYEISGNNVDGFIVTIKIS